jgi:hypothetical protein
LQPNADDQAARQLADLGRDADGSPAAIVEQAVSPATGAIGDTIGHVSPILGGLDNAVGSLDAILDHALEPSVNLAGSLLQPAATVVDHAIEPLSDILGIQGVVASSGNIVMSELPLAGTLHLDDLFSNGAHTDYNLSINSEPAGTSVSLQTGGSVGSLMDKIIGDQQGVDATHDGHDNALAAHALPTSVIDELHLRGSGEGVGLL